MKAGYYINKEALLDDARVQSLFSGLESGGVELYRIRCPRCVQPGTGMALAVGGDGTFLSAARTVAQAGIPLLGVNFGRMGFLSENRSREVLDCLLSGKYSIEEREMLEASVDAPVPEDYWPYALNEAGLHRCSAAMLGIDLSLGGEQLPTYWADGLLVATSSGSTAYSLSAGGPICMPDSNVLIISPVAPHNLNLRPLVVPSDSRIVMSAQSRSGEVVLTLDNRSFTIPEGAAVHVAKAPFRLRMVRLGKTNFIDALRSRLFWGQDVRNMSE